MEGKYLWDIYHSLAEAVNRTLEGAYKLIPPTEYDAYFRLTGTLVYPLEYDILSAMDRVYCEEANKELSDIRTKQQEQQQKDVEQAARKTRRR